MELKRDLEAAREWRQYIRKHTVIKVERKTRGMEKHSYRALEREEENAWCSYLEKMGCPIGTQVEMLDPFAAKYAIRSVKKPWEVLDLHCSEVTPEDIAYYTRAGVKSVEEMAWLALHNHNGRLAYYYREGGFSPEGGREIHSTIFRPLSNALIGSGLSDKEAVAVVCQFVNEHGGGSEDLTVFAAAVETFIDDMAGRKATMEYGRRGARIEIDPEDLRGAVQAAVFVAGVGS